MLTNKDKRPDFAEVMSKEWLVTNGIGGYASSTMIGANTRRYHGLLVASMNPPTARTVMVAKIEESIVFNRDSSYSLSSNQYPGVVHPQGLQHFKFFERRPLPRMKFVADGNHLLKTVFMVHGSNTTVVEYENTGESTFQLQLTPLFVQRDYHSLLRKDDKNNYWMKQENGFQTLYAHYGAPALHFSFSNGVASENRQWYYNIEYARELERGLDYREDYCSVVQVKVVLSPGEKVFLVFSTDEKMMKKSPEALKVKELARLDDLVPKTVEDTFLRDLITAGEQFLVRRNSTDGYTLLAGYHWFTDWGRDTMIAMRGLTIASGKKDVSKSILETFLRSVDQGMLPNRFPDSPNDPVEYNTMDATLWLFVALYEYLQKFQDLDFIAANFDALTDILEHHCNGTRFNIKVTPEGFLSGGEDLAQLTWMDAKVGDYVVTPRHGAPVEIQALWYNALRIYQFFAGLVGKPCDKYEKLGDQLRRHFGPAFLRENGSLNDVIRFDGAQWIADDSIRPNQIYVVSLPFALLDSDAEKQVLETVRTHLLTDMGLRTLSPEHPDFKPIYGGDSWQRDTAYHQGTVWPFLLGEYIEAYLKVNGRTEQTEKAALELLQPLKLHFYRDDCVLGISEIFDGAKPLAGKGTVHQAWSVGAVLKVMLDLKRP